MFVYNYNYSKNIDSCLHPSYRESMQMSSYKFIIVCLRWNKYCFRFCSHHVLRQVDECVREAFINTIKIAYMCVTWYIRACFYVYAFWFFLRVTNRNTVYLMVRNKENFKYFFRQYNISLKSCWTFTSLKHNMYR